MAQCYALLLAASGTNSKVVETIMRHSDINLTIQIYTHVYSEAPTKAIAALLDLSLPPTAEKILKTGTDGRVVDTVGVPQTSAKSIENCLAFCLASRCEKERILANKFEQKTGKNLENRNAATGPINEIKRDCKAN